MSRKPDDEDDRPIDGFLDLSTGESGWRGFHDDPDDQVPKKPGQQGPNLWQEIQPEAEETWRNSPFEQIRERQEMLLKEKENNRRLIRLPDIWCAGQPRATGPPCGTAAPGCAGIFWNPYQGLRGFGRLRDHAGQEDLPGQVPGCPVRGHVAQSSRLGRQADSLNPGDRAVGFSLLRPSLPPSGYLSNSSCSPPEPAHPLTEQPVDVGFG
jgi:hypothetical protein